MALALYHNDMSSCSQKVRLMLAEKGLDWEGDLMKRQGREHWPKIRAIVEGL